MIRRTYAHLLLAALLLLALLPVLAAAGPPGQPPAVHPQVWESVRGGEEAEILVVFRARADLSGADSLTTKEAKGRYVFRALRTVAEASQRELRMALEAQRVDYQSFYIVNALRVRGNSTLVHSLAARHDVARIVPNPRVRGISDEVLVRPASDSQAQGIEGNISRVRAADVWVLGHTGQGVVVAGQDTGYDWDHPALRTQYRGWDGATVDHDYNWHDAIHSEGGICGADSPEPCDDGSHGTHTMGTIVGDDGEGNQIGVAPGAEWIGCRNMDRGYGTPATYMECFEFFLAPYPAGGVPADGDPGLAPHVVNNSWSCPPYEGCDAASLEASVEALRQAGIVVAVSAGNYGGNDAGGCSTVLYPAAIYTQSFTVGGFNHRDGYVYNRSSRGPVNYGGETYTKPDISAPAVDVRSCVPGVGYSTKTGTSMAAPHVAGAVALLLSAAPEYAGDVDAIEGLLTRTAEPRTSTQGCGGDGPTDVPNNEWGWGMLDAWAAVEEATAGWLQGSVVEAGTEAPLSGASVTVALAGEPLGPGAITDPKGAYSLTLPASAYDVTARAHGHIWQKIKDVAVISDTITVQDFALLPARPFYLPLAVKDW
jgi:subtilisin family serine protease